jgi:dTMP kinase
MTPRKDSGGVLIAIEGIDGAGKSTLQRLLARRWRRRGWPVSLRQEPSTPDVAREALKAGRKDPWRAAAYFTLDRLAERESLRRLLSTPRIVLTDRSYYSTMAYQGTAMSPKARRHVERLQRRVTVKPDRVLFLNLPPEVGIERVSRRKGSRSLVERMEILNRVAGSYRKMSRRRDWILLDARKSPEVIARKAGHLLEPWLRRRIAIRRKRA